MHPPIEPFLTGWLPRQGGVLLYWEASGNPAGRPALYLHGGPGSGLGSGGYRRHFDPSLYRVVGLDQRGSGLSTPWAIDDLDRLDTITTQAFIDDIEALRTHLGIDRWLVHGASWGSTLALAYALAHPQRVTEVVLLAVTTGARDEIDWIARGVGTIFPEAFERFAADVPLGTRPVDHYAELLRDPDPGVRAAAADRWDAWEAAHVSLDPLRAPVPFLHDDPRMRRNFATLVTHFWSRDCFLAGPGSVLARVLALEGTPGVLVHGRHDISGPAGIAWRLHRAWPGSRLEIVETEGHGGPLMAGIAREAIDGFAADAIR